MSRYDSGSDRVRLDPREKDMITLGIPTIIVHFNQDGETSSEAYNMENVRYDKYGMEAIARALLPDIIAFYEDPANLAEFERWQAEQRAMGIPPCKPKRRRSRG